MDLNALPISNIIPSREDFEKRLASEQKLHIYLGIDPTATRIHLGHAVSLRILQAFATAGHKVTFLIGDFTALIGDNSDKETERPILTPEQIQQNFQTYQTQASKILDFSQVEVKYNSTWLSQLTFADIIELCQHFSAGDFISRELIKKRLTEGKKVGLHELLYPVMQGYDMYKLEADVQIGGTDQTFNMQAGRTLRKDKDNKDSFVLSTPFLTGTDGRKMSKSWGNAIWLDDTAKDIYPKVMSLPDNLMDEYFKLATNLTPDQCAALKTEYPNPMELKKQLAYIIASELDSPAAAEAARNDFEKTVQNKELPENIPFTAYTHQALNALPTISHAFSAGSSSLLTSLSVSEARRRIEAGAISIYRDEQQLKINDPDQPATFQPGDIGKYGKRDYFRIPIIEETDN